MSSITSVSRKNVMVPFSNKIMFSKNKNENPTFSGRLRLSSPSTPPCLKLPTNIETFEHILTIILQFYRFISFGTFQAVFVNVKIILSTDIVPNQFLKVMVKHSVIREYVAPPD
jgi:hypothetical protein